MTEARGSRVVAWAAAVLAAMAAGALVWFPLMDTDIWWHLAAGRAMVESRHLLRADPFAADTLGMPWVNVHWLFQLAAYGVHAAMGVAGLVIAKTLVVAAGVGASARWLVARVPRALGLPAAVALVGFLYPARHLVLVRPTVLTLAALLVLLFLVERLRHEGRLRWALLLLPLQVVWANVQGLYLLGPGLVAAVLAGDALAALLAPRLSAIAFAPLVPRRTRVVLAATAAAMIAAAALTPYGPRGLALPMILVGRISSVGSSVFSREVSENLAPWLLERVSPGELAAFKWLAALTFLSFVPALRRGFDLGRFILCGVLFVLALLANRNVLLFLWIAGPITTLNLAGWLASTRPWTHASLRRGFAAAALAGLLVMVGARAREARGEPSITELAPFRVPVEAVEHLLASHVPAGPVFCTDRYGGYLAWRLGPDHAPTMDGRLVLRSAEAYAEHLTLADRPDRFAEYRQRFAIRAAVLPTAYPDRFLPLVLWLLDHPPWRLLYTDGTQTLFVYDPAGTFAAAAVALDAPGVVPAIAAELAARHARDPLVLEQALLHLARLAGEAGATAAADALLAPMPGVAARALRARIAYRAGDRARAEQLAEALLERVPDDTESLALLALLARERGDRARALALLRRALAVDPFHSLARHLLDELGF